MKKDRIKIFLSLSILLIFISIGTISATDNSIDDNTYITTQISNTISDDQNSITSAINTNTVDKKKYQININETKKQNNNKQIKKESGNYYISTSATSSGDGSNNNPWTYEDGFKNIQNTQYSGSNLIIKEGYYQLNNTITFSTTNTLNIMGENNNVILNGSNSIKVFKIDSGNIKFSNITITNAQYSGSTTLRHGSAMHITGGNVTIQDSIIKNSTTRGEGGAIYLNYGNLTVINTQFINNAATSKTGGAIYSGYSNLTVINSSFTGNNATTGGGAIAIIGNSTIENTTFTNNKATSGGAIYSSDGNLKIMNATFTQNNATLRGGAIYSLKNLIVTNSTFTNQKTATGAAICAKSENIVLKNNNFENLISENETLNIDTTNIELENNTFKNCSIGIKELKLQLDEKTSEFTSKDKIKFNISVELLYPKYYDSNILNGVEYTIYANDEVLKTTTAPYTITLNPGTYTTYAQLQLTSNKTNTISDIIVSEAPVLTEIYVSNTSQSGDGSYENPMNINEAFNTTNLEILEKITFKNGNYILTNNISIPSNLNRTLTITAEENVLINSTNILNQLITIGNNSTVNISNLVFVEADDTAILNYGNVSINNVTFKESKVASRSSIINRGNANVNNTTFLKNRSRSLKGGAITNEGILKINNSRFENNIASNGGDIYNDLGGSLIIDNSIFENTTAIYGNGGSINNNNGSVLINNSIFNTCSAADLGGAIFSNENLIVDNTNFIGNIASIKLGGAIYTRGNTTISNSNFTKNGAGSHGGAITNSGGNMNITSSQFYNNTALSQGSSIYTNRSTTIIDNCTFTNETSKNGGAIFGFKNNTLNITNSQFTNCSALNDGNGGAVYIFLENNISIANSTFDNCSATNGGAVYTDNKNSTITLTENTFTNITTDKNTVEIKGNIQISNNNFVNAKQEKTYNTVIITIDPVNGTINDTITITTHIVDENNDPITGGYVIFKINGITLKNEKNENIKENIVNGTASIKVIALDGWNRENSNITVVYSGYNNYPSARLTTNNIKILNKEADIEISPINNVKSGQTIKITATISDKETNNAINGGKVVFKLNGVTLKDKDGNVLYSTVKDGIATIEYTIPENMIAKGYNITAVYSSSSYNRVQVLSTLTITKKEANIEITPITDAQSGQTIKITVNVSDKDTNNTVNGGKVVFKLNGVTLKDKDGNMLYSTVKDGIATVEYAIPENMSVKEYMLTAVYSSGIYERTELNSTLKIVKETIAIKDE